MKDHIGRDLLHPGQFQAPDAQLLEQRVVSRRQGVPGLPTAPFRSGFAFFKARRLKGGFSRRNWRPCGAMDKPPWPATSTPISPWATSWRTIERQALRSCSLPMPKVESLS